MKNFIMDYSAVIVLVFAIAVLAVGFCGIGLASIQ